jgi:predicted anti-sigma-YlaC factor YlaD
MSELVTDYLERAIPLRRRLDAQWHLLRCAACRHYFAQMRETVRLLAGQPLAPPAAEAEASVLARLRDGHDPGPAA